MSSETLESSPFFKTAAVPHFTDVSDPSTVSLHLMVKNGESVIDRLLANIGPYVHEIVAVLNDCTDDTETKISDYCVLRGIPFIPIQVTRETHPDLYIQDVKATYDVGRSLGGEEFLGPFTEQPILADWSTARNLGWNKCTKKWRLFLDVDDVVLGPEYLWGLIKILEKNGVELAMTKYEYHVDAEGRAKGASFRERLAVNKPKIRWINPIHEVLNGTTRIAHVDGNLVVRDMRDNKGNAVRIPGRNFKILYHRARSRDWEVSRRLLADLVMEVRHMEVEGTMVDFADNLLAHYLREPTWPEERGWVTAMVGEMHEGREEISKAIELYEESLEMHPGSKTAFRLCRARFKRACELKVSLDEKILASDKAGTNAHDLMVIHQELDAELRAAWQSVVDAHVLGVANKVVHQVLDDGPLFEEMEKIHVAGALLELGEIDKAQKFCEEAVVVFPENSALKQMLVQIKKLPRKLYVSSLYGKLVPEPKPG